MWCAASSLLFPLRGYAPPLQKEAAGKNIHFQNIYINGSLIRESGSETAAEWLSKSVQVALLMRYIQF